MHKSRYNTWRGEQQQQQQHMGEGEGGSSTRCCKLGQTTMLVTHLAPAVDGAFIE
jgi:hypothetical protein